MGMVARFNVRKVWRGFSYYSHRSSFQDGLYACEGEVIFSSHERTIHLLSWFYEVMGIVPLQNVEKKSSNPLYCDSSWSLVDLVK